MLLNRITTALAIAAFSAALGGMRLFINVTYNLKYRVTHHVEPNLTLVDMETKVVF